MSSLDATSISLRGGADVKSRGQGSTGVDRNSDEARIGAAWRELRRASTQALRPLLFGTGPDALELGQVGTLDLLALHGPVRMRDLAEALRVDASTATRAVARLVD